MSADVTYFRIKKIIRSNAECFLCALEDETERKYIDTYLSELVMDSKTREKIIKSRGFCNHHFYKIFIAASKPESPNSHGIALTVKSVIDELVQDLQKQGKNPEAPYQTLKCPACTHLAIFMEICNKKILEMVSSRNEEFLKLLECSKGFCIPHFTALLKILENTLHGQNKDIIKTIIKVEEKNLCRLESELSEYIRRQSYEFSDKDRRAIEDVPLRSIQKIVGRRGISIRICNNNAGK